MSNYSYFYPEDEASSLTAPLFFRDCDLKDCDLKSNLPPSSQHDTSPLSFASPDLECDTPSYNYLYNSGQSSDFFQFLDGHLSYPAKSPHAEKSGNSPPLNPSPVEFKQHRPLLRRALPAYCGYPGDDDGSNNDLCRAPSPGLSSPPLPLTPPPKYEARPPANDGLRNGKRKALCIGANYYTRRQGRPELSGCVNDANNMQQLLTERYHYKPEDMVLLTDEPSQRDPRLMPTRDNIIRAMQWLVHGAQPGDSLVFQFSGHGSQIEDTDGDEDDILDEVIYPADYKSSGIIIDDELHDIMVKPLPPGCRLTAFFDSCHSGSALDLPYTYTRHRSRGILASRNKYAMSTKTSTADVICWSACRDSETAADTKTTGVMSQAFVSALKNGQDHSFQSLFTVVDNTIRADPRFKQEPQLSGSRPIDITRKFTM